jgi:anti-sigma B factor antagonist
VTEQPDEDRAPRGLQVTSRRVDTALVVTVCGEVDMMTAPALSAALDDCFADAGSACCVVDLTNVTCLGSPGLTALVEATRRAQLRREPLRIVVDATAR